MTKKQEKEGLKMLCELFRCKNVKELNELFADLPTIEEFAKEEGMKLNA